RSATSTADRPDLPGSEPVPIGLGSAGPLRGQVAGEGRGPTAVPPGMHVHPDAVLPLVQLQRSRPAGEPKMPVMTARTSGQLALASDLHAAPATFVKDLPRGEFELKDEHGSSQIEVPTEPRGFG